MITTLLWKFLGFIEKTVQQFEEKKMRAKSDYDKMKKHIPGLAKLVTLRILLIVC